MSTALLWVISPTLEARFSQPVNYIFNPLRCTDRCKNMSRLCMRSSMVVSPSGELNLTSKQKVYEVVLRQATLVKRQLNSSEMDMDMEVKPDIALPVSLSLLNEAYNRCGKVCAEYAKTFYLGIYTILLLQELVNFLTDVD